MNDTAVQSLGWGRWPNGFQTAIADFVRTALPTYKQGWKAFQQRIGRAIEEFGLPVLYDVPLSTLGVENSEAEIDLCIEETGTLIHVSGRQTPRHEKELIEFASVSLRNKRYIHGVLIVRSDNRLTLEGRRSSYDYCSRSLLPLAIPVLEQTPLEGVLVVGYQVNIAR